MATRIASALACGLAVAPIAVAAADEEKFAVHGQFTYVVQATNDFNAPYRGPNSLSPAINEETTDATLYLGLRPWSGGEFWINGEVNQGFGLDDTLGVAGFPSGEAYKVGKDHPYLRLPRLFIRQTVNLAGNPETVESAANQLGGTHSANRVVLWLGKFSVPDVFDTNNFAHDPRRDFLNWTAIDTGTFDYAADAWGYTVGGAVEWYQDVWTLRAGVFDLSDVPNSAHLEPGFHEFQMDLEFEHRHEIGDRPGRLLLTLFESRGRMGLLNDALQLGQSTGTPPDVALVRSYRGRGGVSLSLEQQIAPDLGMFVRTGKANGDTEVYEFTDVDRTLAAGISLQGARWHRSDDAVGLAAINNRISGVREAYLNAGGLGILVGDGKLPHPGPEQIIETYYSAAIANFLHVSLDYQWVNHPAYNRDRGPVSVFALRLHAEF